MNYVLVHGACHDAWCWHRTQGALEAIGHTVVAIDLPFEGFESDVAAASAAIAAVDGPCVVAGHSYGGAVITAAADRHENVRHLVYVAALVPDGTPEFLGVMGEMNQGIAGYLERLDDGRVCFSAKSGEFLYNTCAPGDSDAALERLRPMMMDAGPVEAMPYAWRTTPSTYVLCRQDRAIPEPLQRQMARHLTHVAEIDCDHSPFLSANDALVEALTARSILA